jgi:hypothetical protein
VNKTGASVSEKYPTQYNTKKWPIFVIPTVVATVYI